jgi:hypothetical protein
MAGMFDGFLDEINDKMMEDVAEELTRKEFRKTSRELFIVYEEMRNAGFSRDEVLQFMIAIATGK